ncbi:MAG: V-type ATPase subunit [Omnitrophica WOR_2 bacterium]
MLPTGVFGYAAINARVRAMVSTLLSPQEWVELINASDFPALISLLRRTVYGSYLSQVDESELTPRRAVYQIQSQMADNFVTLLRAAPDQTCPLLTQLYREFEVDNLKAVLRGIRSGASWDQIRYVLFPLGEMSVLPAEEMVQSGSISAAVELLRGTPYYDTLSHAMRRFNIEQSLFPLEVALDLDYWRTIWEEINRLSRQDKEQALKIIGSLLDVNNLMWAIRYRVYYKLSEEEIINYTLPFGYQVRDADIREIASGADIPQVISHIFPKMTEVGPLLMDPRKGLPELEVQLQRTILEHSRKAFIGYPFHIGVPLGYMILKEMEVQDLTVLIEAKSSHMPVDEFRPYLMVGAIAK